jgi:hypothetical protein
LPHRLDEHFISYTLDTAQVFNGSFHMIMISLKLEGRGYPYTDPYFIQLVKNLVDIKPSYLRIGVKSLKMCECLLTHTKGTSADGAFYAVPGL